MRKVMLVASDKGELAGFSDDYIKVVSGVGSILSAAATMKGILENHPDAVFSVGSAGAISSHIDVGKAYSFQCVVTPDQDLTSFHLALGATLDSRRATIGALMAQDHSSSLILSSSGKFASEITDAHLRLKADAADMEAYGVAVAASMLSVPFYAVKLITDRVGDRSSIGRISFSLREGRAAMSALVDSILE